MMTKRLDAHQATIDEFIEQNASRAKKLSAVPFLEEEFRRSIEACGAGNMLIRLNAALASTGGRIQIIFVEKKGDLPALDEKPVWGHAGKYVTVFALEGEKDTKQGRRMIAARLFHEIRARSTAAKILFEKEYGKHKPTAPEEIAAFTASLRKSFEKTNLKIRREIEQHGRIITPALRGEFASLAFASHLQTIARDYAMIDEPRFDGPLKGKRKTGTSKWDLLEHLREGLNGLSEQTIAGLRKEGRLGARRNMLVESGLGVAAAIDGKFLASELDRFLQLRQPAPAVPAAPSRPFLYTLKPGRHLIAHMADDFDFIVKMPKSGKTLDFVSRNWLGRGYKLAGERLGGLAVPTMVIDAMDGSKKPFSYLVEKSGARKTDLAIIQKKVVPVFERLKYLAKEKRVSEAEDLIDKYKEFVVAMFRRGVMDFDFTYPYGNCGVDPETGNIYLFDFGELDGNSGSVEMFLEQLGVTNKYFYDDLKQYTNDEIAAYYGISPLQMKDFFTESGESLFGVDLKPGEEGRIRMSFSYSEEQIRRIFMSHTLNETPDDDVISGRGDLAKTAPAKKPARRPGDPYYFAHPDSAPEPDPDREIIPSPNNQPLRAPRPEPPRQSGEEAQEKVRVAREEAAGQDTEAAQNESAVEAQNPNAIP
ncbi:MAG: hypothetical protein PHT32_04645, partial [Candidatus Omnitrophica bacterium]|nr:hypothetical protein [Candidatus Omnitrophota bacterium]